VHPLRCHALDVAASNIAYGEHAGPRRFEQTPHDIVDWKDAPRVGGSIYRAEPRSVVVLFAPIDVQAV
jgi:hypothetical protein